MAWNTPGSNDNDPSGGERNNPWRPRNRNQGGVDAVLDKLKGLFDGGGPGGGSPLRWIAIALAIWMSFNCFVLVAEQQRGVVLRFGKFSRILEPGPSFKLPWPVETVQKVEAIRVAHSIVHARSVKGETFMVALEDIFAAAFDAGATSPATRKAGFLG